MKPVLYFLSAFLAFGISASAECVLTGSRIASVLLNVSSDLNSLKKDGYSQADTKEPTCKTIQPAITNYEFHFRTCGNCAYKTVTLIVEEDQRPAAADGPNKYTSKTSQP